MTIAVNQLPLVEADRVGLDELVRLLHGHLGSAQLELLHVSLGNTAHLFHLGRFRGGFLIHYDTCSTPFPFRTQEIDSLSDYFGLKFFGTEPQPDDLSKDASFDSKMVLTGSHGKDHYFDFITTFVV